MARTVRDAKLETRTARGDLKASGKPHYRAIDEGLHLGYRKGKSAGKWVMRRYAGGQSYVVELIGLADDTIDADGAVILSFAQAQAKARALFVEQKRVAAGMPAQPAGPYAVKDAVNDYLAWLEEHRKSARVVRWMAEASIVPALGSKSCARLTKADLDKWLTDQAKEPARLRTKAGKAQRYRTVAPDQRDEEMRRRKVSANHRLVILKAALNHAWREKKIASDDAWRGVRPFRNVDIAKSRYLTVAEAKRLINAAEPDFRQLIRAALETGCRYSELAALVANDFNPDSGTLHIRTSKTGKGRHVVLTADGIEFFRGLVAGRSGQDRLLLKSSGGHWLKSHQHRPMREACRRAKIEPPVGFHTTRHTYASLSAMNGVPLMVLAQILGHTDTRMAERHYGHLAPSYVADAIRAGAPRFGSVESNGNVVPLNTGH